jgi:hypothetical protein
MAETSRRILVSTTEEFSQQIQDSVSTDEVKVQISRLSDGYTYNFTTLVFENADNYGDMTYFKGYLWKHSFVPPTIDKYDVVITDNTLNTDLPHVIHYDVAGTEAVVPSTGPGTEPISVAGFKTYFDRDFTFGTALTTVRDVDIQKAIDEALALFNDSVWDSDAQEVIAFYNLTAHCLVKIMTSGGANSTGSFAISNKSAGPLSVGYQIPQDLANNPILSLYLTTQFGLKYVQLLAPNLIGNMGTVEGITLP